MSLLRTSAEMMNPRLLLTCLHLESCQDDRALLEQASPEDWEKVFQQSVEHRVTSLLYLRLHQEPAGLKLTSAMQARLRNSYLYSVRDKLRLYKAIEQILEALHKVGIPVIPLKGVHLAEKVYGNIGLRPMGDVDLLIQRSDLARALSALQDLGYQPGYPFEVERECQVMHHLPVLYKLGTLPVELHWNLAPLSSPFNIPIEQIWQAAQPGVLEGVEVLEMTPEDLLLHLCLHTAYMEYFSSGLRPICDIAWTIRAFQGRLDWEKLRRQARLWGAERSTWLALRVTRRLLDDPLLGSFMKGSQPAGYDPILEDWAIGQIFEPPEIGGKLAQVWAPQPWTQRGWHFVRNLFPASWEMRSAYPDLARGLLWPLAYLKHLGIVFQRNRQAVWRLWRRDPNAIAEAEKRQKINRLVAWQAGDIG